MRELIPESRVEQALTYLAETDEQLGQLVGRVEGLSHSIKSRKATVFLVADGTVAERNALAESAKEVRNLCEEHSNAVADRETIKLKRKLEETVISVWQTIGANHRRGVI